MAWRNAIWYLLAIGLASVAVFGMIFYLSETDEQTEMLVEASKAALQLAVIVLVGGLAKSLIDQASKERDRVVTLNEFRKDCISRMVRATNQVRKAPLLIESHATKEMYGGQMSSVLNARIELSLLRHDLVSAEAFSHISEIIHCIREMEGYLLDLIDEWRDKYHDLPDASPYDWLDIQDMELLGDLRSKKPDSKFNTVYILNYKTALTLMRKDIWESVGLGRSGTREVRAT